MTYANILVRRAEGGVETFGDLDAARKVARDGDVIVKAHRGGHVEYEAAVSRSGGLVFVDQPPGWKPRMPVYRGPG